MNVCATGLHETKPVEDGLSLAKDWGILGGQHRTLLNSCSLQALFFCMTLLIPWAVLGLLGHSHMHQL